jgi:hypothetical protein
MAEVVETPIVLNEEHLVPTRASAGGLVDRWVETDPDRALKLIEARVRTLEQLRVASIRATYPSDWIVNISRDADGGIISERGYLQDIGADRAGKVWGIEVGSPAIEREDFPDANYTYHMIAEAWCKVTGERLDYVEGSRSSGDKFFTRGLAEGEKPDPADIRKAAWANLHGRAVRALGGLSGVPLDMLRQAGLDVAKCIIVDYQKGGKGGESTGASVGTTEAIIPWGNAKGTKVPDLTDKDLAYYLSAYERDVKDPVKAKFQKNNERMLGILTAEKERRGRAAEQEAETGTKAPGAPDSDGDGKPTTRGTKLANLHTRLVDACGKDGRVLAATLRTMTAETFGLEIASLSDLTEEQLDKLSGVPDKTITDVAEKVKGVKK